MRNPPDYDEMPVKRDGSNAKCSRPGFMTLFFAKFAALLDAQSANSAPCRRARCSTADKSA
jgi:hypothetical protein